MVIVMQCNVIQCNSTGYICTKRWNNYFGIIQREQTLQEGKNEYYPPGDIYLRPT